ncbi:MAG: ribosome silencing factor [bacterium]
MARPRGRRHASETESLSRALRAAEAAESKRAEDVVVLDLRGQTLVTDYFVICTGGSRVQIRAIVDAVHDAMADLAAAGGMRVAREGDAAAQWVLLDFGDVVAHVFGPEARAFYRLERLWGNARVVSR